LVDSHGTPGGTLGSFAAADRRRGARLRLRPQEVVYPDTATGEAKAILDATRPNLARTRHSLPSSGWFVADIFITALKGAGRDLNNDSSMKSLHAIKSHKNPFGG
jgi:hypothetical protein